MYFDANNLYGQAMSQELPYSDFEWESVTNHNTHSNGIGQILEVDLEYPIQLHNEHDDYPLAP